MRALAAPALALGLLLAAGAAPCATIRVGPNRPVRTVREAAQVAKDGDLVLIDAGTYRGDVASWRADRLVVRGVGRRPHMEASGA